MVRLNVPVRIVARSRRTALFFSKSSPPCRRLAGPINQASPVAACMSPSSNPPLGARPMYRLALRQATVYSALLYFALAVPAAGQGRGKVKQKTDLSPVGGADSLNNLKFRNRGPSVAGGRVAAVVGVPGARNVYYVGAAAGGVWKTIDGGDSWEAVFKDQPTSSIGAVALAPSNPNVVWVGTGEGNPRNDVVDGRGVFMS